MAFWKSTELKKKMAHFLIMVLSLNDLAVGIICSPLFASMYARELLGKSSCFLSGIQVFWFLITCGCSFKTLFVMNLERYLAIVHPIFHRTKVTKVRLVKCLIVLWLFALALIIFLFYRPDVICKFLSLEMSLSMAALVFIYARIYIACTRSSKNLLRKNGINPSSKNQFKASQILLYGGGLFRHLFSTWRPCNFRFPRDERRSSHDSTLVRNITCVKF